MTFIELHKIFKKTFGTDRLADIARKLNVSPQVVSSWKSKDYVPFRYVEILKELINNENLLKDELFNSKINNGKTGESEKSDNTPDYVFIIIKYYRYFLKNIFLLIGIPVISIIISLFYVYYIATPSYVSNCTVLPVSTNTASGIENMASNFGINIKGENSQYNLSSSDMYPHILRSRRIASELLETKFNSIKYGSKIKLINIINDNYDSLKVWSEKEKIRSIRNVQNLINVNLIRTQAGVNLLNISTSLFEPLLAKELLDSTLAELERITSKFRLSRIGEKKNFIESRLKNISVDLANSENKIKEFRENNRSILSSPALMLEQERILRELEVLKEMYITMKTQFEMVQIEEVENNTFVEVLDPPEIPLGRTSPRATQILFLTLILSFFISFSVVYIKEELLLNFELKKFILLK